MNNIVIASRCHWCSRQLSPLDLAEFSSGQRMCSRCHEWHVHALQVLAGELPRGCQGCGLTLAELNSFATGATVRMYVVPKDGVYQVLCVTCKDAYCAQRADLYRGTQFGQRLKLA